MFFLKPSIYDWVKYICVLMKHFFLLSTHLINYVKLFFSRNFSVIFYLFIWHQKIFQNWRSDFFYNSRIHIFFVTIKFEHNRCNSCKLWAFFYNILFTGWFTFVATVINDLCCLHDQLFHSWCLFRSCGNLQTVQSHRRPK